MKRVTRTYIALKNFFFYKRDFPTTKLDPFFLRALFGGAGLMALFFGFIGFWGELTSSPEHRAPYTTVEIVEGNILSDVAVILQEESIIRSKVAFIATVYFLGAETSIRAGRYLFVDDQSVFEVARRMIVGDFRIPKLKIRVPEGATVFDIAQLLEKEFFPSFNKAEFIQTALPYEGYLFPDTYYFPEGTTITEILDEMKRNSDTQLARLRKEAEDADKSFDEVLVMASLIEKEAHTYESRRLISGILWRRLAINMPLQVDASFNYVNGKNTFELTLSDLKIDSPYNTYANKGLPPGPIANPSVDSIEAALYPHESDFLYYLSDRQGNLYYGRDFEEHKENRRNYLN